MLDLRENAPLGFLFGLVGGIIVTASGFGLYYGYKAAGHADPEIAEMASKLRIASWGFLPFGAGLLIIAAWSFGCGLRFDNWARRAN